MGASGRPPEPGIPEEQVLVVPRPDLVAAGVLPQGYAAGGCDRFLSVVARRGSFRPRSAVEEDPSLKQVIPYAVVMFRESVFLLRRTTRGGEVRLHRKLYIGVGGHVNAEGVPTEDLVEAGLRRELAEELSFDGPYAHRPLGIINDDGTAVGSVHVGLVYRIDPQEPGVRVRETDVLEGDFVPITSLRPLLGDMESWSRLVAESLFFHKT